MLLLPKSMRSPLTNEIDLRYFKTYRINLNGIPRSVLFGPLSELKMKSLPYTNPILKARQSRDTFYLSDRKPRRSYNLCTLMNENQLVSTIDIGMSTLSLSQVTTQDLDMYTQWLTNFKPLKIYKEFRTKAKNINKLQSYRGGNYTFMKSENTYYRMRFYPNYVHPNKMVF